MAAKIPSAEIQRAIESEFRCHRCGNCCKGDGIVDIGQEEAERIAKHLGLSLRRFVADYTVSASGDRYWLRDQANEERWCIFLQLDADGNYGCQVNAAKPDQCRSFPEKWRNPDSFRACEGLRAMMRALRDRAAAQADSATE